MKRRSIVEFLEFGAGVVALFAGVLLFAQGRSFLRPEGWGSVQLALESQAQALALAGVAIACLAFLGLRIYVALGRLEARVRLAELARIEPPDPGSSEVAASR